VSPSGFTRDLLREALCAYLRARMPKLVGGWVVGLLTIACGGASGGESPSGGASNGGSPSTHSTPAGQGGSAGTAGGGASNGGTSGNPGAAGMSSGGVAIAGVADKRCPSRQPTGACTEEQAGVSCQYDVSAGCLCATSPASAFGACTLVDPTCPSMSSGGVSSAPPAAGGAGGSSANAEPPPRHLCACSSGRWLCNFAT
jgi:hypothetical protein